MDDLLDIIENNQTLLSDIIMKDLLNDIEIYKGLHS